MDIFKPVQYFADLSTYSWFHLAPHSYWGDTLNFFIYDTVKIGLLLIAINYVMAITRYYFPMERTRDILTKHQWYGLDYLLAALLGVVTPFCSCSSIPLFIGFLSAGIPLGVTFAFLISSPLVNESSLYLFPAIFGVKVTLLYNLIGIGIAMFGGFVIQKLNLEKYVRSEFRIAASKLPQKSESRQQVPFKVLISHWSKDAQNVTKTVFPYVLLGVGIGALIHGFVPESLIARYLSAKQWWVIPLAVLSGAPLYANSVGVIPVMEALVNKGIPLGTALAFMTATVTISLPEGLMLSKILKRQLLTAFFASTVIGSMVIGYIFNLIG